MTTPNTETLFDIPEQKSPRLLWFLKHNLKIQLFGGYYYAWNVEDERQLRENQQDPADFHMGLYYPDLTGRGHISDDAITDWAKKNNVKLWNEEQL